MERKGDWIQTYTGKIFWPLDPRPEEVDIEDIAHALSFLCRFGGHTEKFYSVAEHSVRLSYIVPQKDRLWGLLHDASEAYLVDLPRPLKYHSAMGALYRGIEEQLMNAICERFGLSPTMPQTVFNADVVMLITEKRDLLKIPPPLKEYELMANPLEDVIIPTDSFDVANLAFLDRFDVLSDVSKEA